MSELLTQTLEGWGKNDYRAEDGHIYCRVCGEKREEPCADLPGVADVFNRRHPRNCKCVRDESEKIERFKNANRLQNKIDDLVRMGVTSTKYRNCTFANDTGKRPKMTEFGKDYVNVWKSKLESSEPCGVLFYGEVGNSKTFTAVCIVNEIIERYQDTAYIISLCDLLYKPKQEFERALELIAECDLVVLDDLGAERTSNQSETKSKYDSFEVQDTIPRLLRVINARDQAQKPVIITTNYDISVLENETREDYKRIYDRVLGMCPVRIAASGESIRRTEAERIASKERAEYAERRIGVRLG